MVRPRGSARAVKPTGAREIILISFFLVAITWLVFSRTVGYDFVNYDDHVYVYQNPIVTAGLTPHGIVWAFAHTHARNWHPLTTLSHMVDCEIFGLKAGGHHFTNVLLHTLAVLLLFFVLRRMTGNIWRSAFVAALFAIHPLHVESVAWVAERKDVLSAVFFMLTLAAYASYVRQPSLGRYLMVSVFFACGLMSKSMLVSVPVVLWLLDYWPLKRSQTADVRRQRSEICRLIIEKIPLFALSILCGVVTFLIQERSAGLLEQLPLGWRINNAIVSAVTYIWQMFWPTRLAVFYPHPEDRLAIWQVALALGFLIAIIALAFIYRKTRPYVLVGWLWYVVMLLPVIGVVQVGLQGHADRYTYLPHVGLYIALTWLVSDVPRSLPHRKEILAIVGGGIVIVLSACAWKQTTYWRSSETLWTHTLAVTTDNDVALTNLGTSLMDRGQLDDALSYFQSALAIRSRSEHNHYNLSLALIHDSVGNVLGRKGRLDEAIAHFRQAIAFRPDYPDAHYNLGTVLFRRHDLNGAISEWRTTLSLHPNDPGTNANLGNALVQKGLLREAANHYEIAMQSEPDSPLPLNNLAWLMSAGPDDSLRNGVRAVELARNLNRVSKQNNPFFIRTLAAAYAEAGQFDLAIETAQGASELANAQGQHSLAIQIQDETDLYRQHLPFRDQTLRNAR